MTRIYGVWVQLEPPVRTIPARPARWVLWGDYAEWEEAQDRAQILARLPVQFPLRILPGKVTPARVRHTKALWSWQPPPPPQEAPEWT